MQSIFNLKWFSIFVIILVFFSLALPCISYAAEADDRGGGGESDAESEAEKEAAKEAAEAEQAAADAAEVSAAAAAAGVDVDVAAVSTAGPATPGNVSVNGVSMSKEAALGAVGAIGAATNNGAKSPASVGVDVNATFSGYASGKLSGGQVAGTDTGYIGTPTTVAKTEIANTVSLNAVDLATQYTSINTAPTIGTMAPSVTQAPVPTDRMFDPTPIGSKPSSMSISFNGGFSMPGAPTPTSVKSQSIATTPSNNPSYNSFDKSVPSYSPGITSVSVNDGKITGTYTDGSTRDLSANEIDSINSNTPTPANTSWTSGISKTFNSVVSSVTNAARTLGSYVGLTDAPAPAPTYTDLNSLADRLNATISAQALNDIGVEVTPGVVDALNVNNINVATAPNVNYGFVDKKSLTSALSDFDTQYTESVERAKEALTNAREPGWEAAEAQRLSEVQQDRVAREALEARKDADLSVSDEALAAANQLSRDAVAAQKDADLGVTTQSAVSAPNTTATSPDYDPFAAGQPANTYSNPNVTGVANINNIGTVPAPGPIGSFTGTVGVSLDDVTTISVVNLSGSSNPAENAKAATPAQVAALGGVDFSQADIAALGKAIAGEVPGSIVGKIQSGQTLTANELAEIGVVTNVVTTRALADKASLFGPFAGSIESVVNAGLTDQNMGQFSAFNDDTIDQTEATYNTNPAAFDAVAKSMIDGTVAKTYGLNVAAPTPKANAYYNDSIASPGWASSLTNTNTFGTAPNAHTAGSLPGEYKSVGQVEGVGSLNTAALSAMNKAATGGFVSGTGQYGGISPNTGAPDGSPNPAGPAGMGTGPEFSGTVNSPSVNTGRSPSVSSPTNNDVSLPDRVSSVPSSRPTPSGVSLPDTVGVPPSRPSENFVNNGVNPGNINAAPYSTSIAGTPSLKGGFVNNADNPGNPNAPTYSASIPGTPNTRDSFTNTADNPGNPNAPTYSASIAGTPSLKGGFVNNADNPGNPNAPTYSASIAGTPQTNNTFNNTADNPGNPNAPTYSASIPGNTAPTNNFTNTVDNPGNPNAPTYSASIPGNTAPTTDTTATDWDKVAQDQLNTLQARAAREALEARKDADLSVNPAPAGNFVNNADNPGNPNAPTYSASIPGTPNTRDSFTNTADNPGNPNAPTYSASIPGNTTPTTNTAPTDNLASSVWSGIKGVALNARDIAVDVVAGIQNYVGPTAPVADQVATDESFYSPTLDAMVTNNINMGVTPDFGNVPTGAPVSLGFDPSTGYTDEFGNNLSIDPLSGVGTITNSQGDFQDNLSPTETMQALSDATFANPAVSSYRSYADIAAEEEARIANEMAQGRISDAYAEYAETRTIANELDEQERVAAIKDESFSAPATTPSISASALSSMKDIALSTAALTAQLARSAVDGVKSLLGIEATIDTRVVSTTPLDGTYAPFGNNTVTGKLDGQLTTDQAGVTTEATPGVTPENVASVPQNTAPIDARFGTVPSAATTPTTPTNNSYYSPTLNANLNDNTFNANVPTGFNTPTPGQPVSTGFDFDAYDDQGNTLSVDPTTGIGTAYDTKGNVIGTRSREETQAALNSGGLNVRSNPDSNPPTNVTGPSNNDSDLDNGTQTDSTDQRDVGNTNDQSDTTDNSPNSDTEADTEAPVSDEPTGIVDRVVNTVTNTAKTVYSGVVGTIKGWFGGGNSRSLTDSTAGEQSNRDLRQEPVIERALTSLTVHLNIPVECPNTGLTTGYIYEAEYIESYPNGNERPKYVVKPMCGAGGPRTYATEIANDLQSRYGFGRINIDQLLDLMEFNFNPQNEVIVTN